MHINSLDYDRNRFVFGSPITTDIGIIRFLTYEEYLDNVSEVSLIGQNSLHIYYDLKEQYQKNKASKEELADLEQLKKMELFYIVKQMPQLRNAYSKVFQLVFDMNSTSPSEIILDNINIFNFIRQLVMDMNLIVEERVSPNEVIQKAFARSKRIEERDSEKTTFVDIATSIVASTNNGFDSIRSMTVFQIYALYSRIAAIHNFKTTTLFATVAEKVDIEPWNKHIDLFEQKKDTMTRDQFTKKFGDMLSG